MGKGSKRRPTEDKQGFDSNWDRIFRKNRKTVKIIETKEGEKLELDFTPPTEKGTDK